MMKRSILRGAVAAALLLFPIAGQAVFAAGGGGGITYRSYFLEDTYDAPADLFGIEGYGYGENEEGIRIGGFGLTMFGGTLDDFAGAFGGMLVGTGFDLNPLSFGVEIRLGGGYLAASMGGEAVGALLDGKIELGVNILSWMRLAVFGGMQVTVPLIPVGGGSGEIISIPTIGGSVLWGAF